LHGGSQFIAPAKLDRKTIDELALLTPMAPLHQEACLEPARSLLSLRPATDCAGWGRELDLESNDGTVSLVSLGSSSVEISRDPHERGNYHRQARILDRYVI
jgi:hypothetical protein